MIKKIWSLLTGVMKSQILEQIDNLDNIKPFILAIVKKKVSPEKIVDEIVDYVQRIAKSLVEKIF